MKNLFFDICCLTFYFLNIIYHTEGANLQDKSATFGSTSNLDGIPVAFVDYDGDSFTDILVLNNDRNSIHVVHGNKQDRGLLVTISSGEIASVMPGDFNGDSLMDIVVLVSKDPQKGPFKVYTSYRLTTSNMTPANDTQISFTYPPLMLDYNADGIADLMGDVGGTAKIYIGSPTSGFEMKQSGHYSISAPGYTAFVDALNDFRPSIFSMEGDKFVFYTSEVNNNLSNKKIVISLPPGSENMKQMIGAPVFNDWFFKGSTSMLVPYCTDKDCQDSQMAVYDFLSSTWYNVTVNYLNYKFVPSSKVSGLYDKVTLPQIMPIRAGDFNLDQIPDALVLMQSNGKFKAVLLKGSLEKPGLVFTIEELNINDPIDVAFFDYNEEGTLDIISTHTAATQSSFKLFEQTSVDAYFLKVMVLTGLCSSSSGCPKPPLNKLPYGLPVPGATLIYITEAVNGGRQTGKAMISTTSGFQSMQLPFHIFGLGSFANYIEDLTLGMPSGAHETRKHTFNFLVPKSKVVLIPYPLDQPNKWTYQLFLNALNDKKVIYVAVTLVCTALVVIVIICILQYMEYREDKLEKLQEVQKFNFDAM